MHKISRATAAASVGLSLTSAINDVLSKYNFDQMSASDRENAVNDLEIEIFRSTVLTETLNNLKDYVLRSGGN